MNEIMKRIRIELDSIKRNTEEIQNICEILRLTKDISGKLHKQNTEYRRQNTEDRISALEDKVEEVDHSVTSF